MRRRCFVGVVVVTVLVVVLLLWARPGSPSYKDSRGTAARAAGNALGSQHADRAGRV